MAAVDKGTAHLYGVSGTISSATVQDYTQKDSFANKATTENESGNQIERRYDDITKRASITIKIQSGYSIPAIGTQLTYETVLWVIEEVTRVQKFKDFRLVTLDIITSEFIVLS